MLDSVKNSIFEMKGNRKISAKILNREKLKKKIVLHKTYNSRSQEALVLCVEKKKSVVTDATRLIATCYSCIRKEKKEGVNFSSQTLE